MNPNILPILTLNPENKYTYEEIKKLIESNYIFAPYTFNDPKFQEYNIISKITLMMNCNIIPKITIPNHSNHNNESNDIVITGNKIKFQIEYFVQIQNVHHWRYEPIGKKLATCNNQCEERCLRYISKNPFNIIFIRPENLTKNIIETVVKLNGMVLKHVPIEYWDDNLCKSAIDQNVKSISLIWHITKKIELFEYALSKNNDSLKYIFNCDKTLEIFEKSFQLNGLSLNYVSQLFSLNDLSQSVYSHFNLPFTLYKIAVSQNWKALHFVPKEKQNIELYEIALKQSFEALRFIPKDIVLQSQDVIKYVPPELITDEICKIACMQNGNPLQYVPPELITDEMCQMACMQNGNPLQYIKQELITKELVS